MGMSVLRKCFLYSSLTLLSALAMAGDTGAAQPPVPSRVLFDFTDPSGGGLEDWVESSDTVREVGMSKASFVIQQTRRYRRAVFFALLDSGPTPSSSTQETTKQCSCGCETPAATFAG